MGFFSQLCEGCHKSILANANLQPMMRWMNRCVVIRADGQMISGHYSGYSYLNDACWPEDDAEADECSRVLGCDYDDDGNSAGTGPTVWHHACWQVAGEPREYRGESKVADDQGYFFDEDDYMIPEPTAAKAN